MSAVKILVVDDEADVRLLFEQRFRREIREGQLVFSYAFSGEEALRYLGQEPHYSQVVLILSDINMPGMSGLELLRQIRQDRPNPPPLVMMITAYGDPQSHAAARQLGANELLSKPLDFALLRQKLLLAL
ncbi:Response regulator receiver domain-containing protein [Hymenobacter daecheongensis DSM 21074]|uniref:Response regulator receiver domain-containing protein n=1 Tax=Hymenobacter daecheongensis DSM 21074 TaxID=1121955 RepID=A0A1M6AN39_9BACT|nr:response regulator [Hymenobacter daecheongensis]SHI37929.1 Response regulator receiver domain-containing protein [Hymenobacter daecheongensis DSM 21074]